MKPRHAQPCALAAFSWKTGMQWGVGALAVAAVAAAATTVGGTPRRAAAAVPPPVVVTSSQGSASMISTMPIGLLPSGTSASVPPLAPGSTGFVPPGAHGSVQASSLAADGIPATALLAYKSAAHRELAINPTCGLPWPLLAGIGRVESNHGRFAGAVLHTNGVSTPNVIGIPLDGTVSARITDTDDGRLDGDKVYDRAVGPMQFIPSTWAGYGVDANGDGTADPFNIFDAAAAAADYLCAAGGDLTTLAGQLRAVRAYNDSDDYIRLVLQLEVEYARGVPGLTVPILPSDPTLPPRERSTVPPVDPGPPLGIAHKPKLKPTPTPSKSTSGSHSATPTPTRSTSGSTSGTPTGTPCPTPTPTGTETSSPSDSGTPTPTGTSCPTSSEPPTTGTSTGQTNTASATQPSSSSPGATGSTGSTDGTSSVSSSGVSSSSS
jgi:membrane-bound lytic murein transglycosylase B